MYVCIQDMGGGALMLALAHVIMSAQLPVRLRVLVPAVENAISGNAYRCAWLWQLGGKSQSVQHDSRPGNSRRYS